MYKSWFGILLAFVALLGVAHAAELNLSLPTAGDTPFGGPIQEVQNCDDGLHVFLKVGPPRPGNFIYLRGVSTLDQFQKITQVGVWVLGMAGHDAYCLSGGNTYNGKLITVVGTSNAAGGSLPTFPPDTPASTTPPVSSDPTGPFTDCHGKKWPGSKYAGSTINFTRGTAYAPSGAEGGGNDTASCPLVTLQQYLSGQGSYVSVAIDNSDSALKQELPYGTLLNIPQLEETYNQGKHIPFRRVDVGVPHGSNRIDIAVSTVKQESDNRINRALHAVIVGSGGNAPLGAPENTSSASGTPPSTTPPTAPTAPDTTSGGNEQAVRQQLSSMGISVNNSPCASGVNGLVSHCTNVNGLPKNVLTQLQSLKSACGCSLTITGGTEPGHKSHGIGNPIVDLRLDPTLDNYVTSHSTGKPIVHVGWGTEYDIGPNRYVNETGLSHWHVIFH